MVSYTMTGGVLGCSFFFIFLVFIIYDMISKILQTVFNKKDPSKNTSLDIRIMIYLELLIILLHIALTIINFIFSTNNLECKHVTSYTLITFHVSRCLMYFIFARRITVIYGDTIFSLKSCYQHLLYLTIIIYSCAPYIINIRWKFIQISYDKQFGCIVKYPSYIFVMFAIFDILIAVYCLYLFIVPLHRLISRKEYKQISCKLYHVMIKYSVLYCTSICSCLVYIIISYNIVYGFNYCVMDAFINGIILLLLHPIHNKLYKSIVCYPAHKLCLLIWNAPNEHKHDYGETNLDNVRNKQSQSFMTSTNDVTSTEDETLDTIMKEAVQDLDESIRNLMKEAVQRKFMRNDDDIELSVGTPIFSECSNSNALKRSIESTKSWTSMDRVQTLEFERKKSNTLRLIDYESTKLF